MNFKQVATISSFLSKDYAEKIFKLIFAYKDISASEAASRLGLHIRTTQDFLETMTQFEILDKKEVFEKKRPYFRYSLQNNKIEISIDLKAEFENISKKNNSSDFMIREMKNSGAKFTVARNGEYFSTVSIWTSEGRSSKERKINLTKAQGIFLYHLPFPEASPLTVDEIINKASIEMTHKNEILNLINELIDTSIIEKI